MNAIKHLLNNLNRAERWPSKPVEKATTVLCGGNLTEEQVKLWL
ncbi:hypothetical protein [Meiothermus sp.]|nr:hypothetical protein [Meiothermus sp.]GIW33903.1 MAG: hypothetical protein KatS3mg072_1236 [Meiothermus sp.]